MQYPLAKMSNPYWRFALLIIQPENDEAFASRSITVTNSATIQVEDKNN